MRKAGASPDKTQPTNTNTSASASKGKFMHQMNLYIGQGPSAASLTQYTIEDATIDSALIQKMLKDLKERPDLTKFTLENNTIKDVDGMCQVFALLKNYDKLEAINFRLNNFNERIIEALAEGIKMKKELRVLQSLFNP